MPEYLPVFVVGFAIALVAAICDYLALVLDRPEPSDTGAIR